MHAVEGRRRRMRLVQVGQQVVDEVRKRFRRDHTDPQWYNNRTFSMAGTLFVVATPIGNLEDITARALRILGEVALIAAEDTRRTAHLLARYAIKTPTTSLHEHNEARKAPSLIARLTAGENIALVSDAGMPLMSDP